MHTNTHLWASLQEGVETLQPEWRQGNAVSDHVIGLAPDRQRLLRQPVRGPKLTLQSYFGFGWLHAITLRKTEYIGPQSFCLCHYWALFNHSLVVFKSSGHINKHAHTQRQHIQRQTERELNPLDFCSH